MDEAMRNAIGRIFARECDVLESWGLDGPLPQLRDDVGEGRDGPLTPQNEVAPGPSRRPVVADLRGGWSGSCTGGVAEFGRRQWHHNLSGSCSTASRSGLSRR